MKLYVIALSIISITACSDSQQETASERSNSNSLNGSWDLKCRFDFSKFGNVGENIKKSIALYELKINDDTMIVYGPESDESTKIIEVGKHSYKITNQVGGSYQLEYASQYSGIQKSSANIDSENVLTIKGMIPGVDGSQVVDDKFLCYWVR